ncbi:LysR family transcriptional regulator [Citrobacter youngae]|uniref:LysR family transcriptional regulator n=1 Tax=Citrobacter youngae TaxID=133448 RepID=UPI0039B5BCFC
MNLNIRDLTFFYVIADVGSLAQASERLGRSQPALSKCIQRLEEEVGTQLLTRSGHGITLTAAGELMRERARKLCFFMEQTEQDLENYVRGVSGKIRIGCVPTVAEYLIPKLCQAFLTENPLAMLEIVPGVNNYLWDNLQNYQLDIIIVTKTISYENAIIYPIMEDAVVLVGSCEHPIFTKELKSITPQDLVEYKWLLSGKNTASRRWIDQFFISRGLPPPRAQIETSSFHLMPKILAANKELLGFIPRRNLTKGGVVYKQLKEIPLEGTANSRHFILGRLKDRSPSPITERLIRMIREQGQDMF